MKSRRKDKQHEMLEHDFTFTKPISENVPKHAIGIELFCFERFSSLCSSEHLPATVVFCAITGLSSLSFQVAAEKVIAKVVTV